MSDNGSPPSDGAPGPHAGARGLLETLESIREVLDDRNASDDEIPVLREIVQPETTTDSAPANDERPVVSKPGELFDVREFADRLLDERWKQQSEAVLDAARRHAAAATVRGPGAQTARAREFQHRVHTEVGPRLESLMEESLATLRQDLLEVLRTELERLAEDCFGSTASSADEGAAADPASAARHADPTSDPDHD